MFFKKTSVIVMLLLAWLLFQQPAIPEILSGSVNQEHVIIGSGVIIDGKTGLPVAGALVSLPSENINTITNKNGTFQLHLPDGKPVILSVKKDGYKPFSLAVDKRNLSAPMRLAISEQSLHDIVIDSRLHHLGDDKFSERSANAGDFSAPANGPYFLKEFYIDNINPNNNTLLIIGSIIGIDTIAAQSFRQSNVRSASSSPVKVYLNSEKLGEISLNGDNHVFRIPNYLLRPNRYNIVKVETGVNQDSDRDVDYDDIEFMNLFLKIQ